MSAYNPQDWYWIVAGSTTQVWSSARVTYVPTADAAYATWLQLTNVPTRIDTEASLANVFSTQYPAGWHSSPVPQEVTRFQIRAVLYSMPSTSGTAGKTFLDDVNDWVAAQGGLTLLAWTEATTITRLGATVAAAQAQFGFTNAQLDAMFIAAGQVSA